MGIIFVGGVHAVGKSTACASTSTSLGLPHYSAGALIKAEKASAISNGSKAVLDVGGNQVLLIRSIQKVSEKYPGTIIIDGHFTLLNSEGNIETISVDVYRSLSLEGIVVFQDDPKEITQRLVNRDNVISNSDFIEMHQCLELDQAKRVAVELDVPINILKAFDETGFKKLIAAHLSK